MFNRNPYQNPAADPNVQEFEKNPHTTNRLRIKEREVIRAQDTKKAFVMTKSRWRRLQRRLRVKKFYEEVENNKQGVNQNGHHTVEAAPASSPSAGQDA